MVVTVMHGNDAQKTWNGKDLEQEEDNVLIIDQEQKRKNNMDK